MVSVKMDNEYQRKLMLEAIELTIEHFHVLHKDVMSAGCGETIENHEEDESEDDEKEMGILSP